MGKRGEVNPVTGITDGKLRTLLKSNLRPIWRNTSRKVFINSVRRKATNPKTGRLWNVLDCSDCGRVMGVSEKARRTKKDGELEKKAKSVYEIDHVDGITPLGDIRETLGDHFYSMIHGRQEVVCVTCHKSRTAKQATERNK
jgi:hypothetical protein